MIDHAELAHRASDLAGLDKAALAGFLADCETVIRQAQAAQARALAEVERRGVLAEYGYGSVAAMLADTVNITRREATKRTTRAHALHPSLEGSTEVPALAPRTQEAFADGAIGVKQVDEIAKTLGQLPAAVPAEVREETEHTLVTLARVSDAFAVRKAGRHALALTDPDGALPSDKELREPERELHLRQRRDGRYGLTATLDTETGALLDTLLSPLTKPRPAENGEADVRTAAQRRGDGFADLLLRVQRSVEMPTEAGERPTVVVTIDYRQLMGDLTAAATAGLLDHIAAQAVLNSEHPLTGEQARRIACDANILPAVLGGPSETLDHGAEPADRQPGAAAHAHPARPGLREVPAAGEVVRSPPHRLLGTRPRSDRYRQPLPALPGMPPADAPLALESRDETRRETGMHPTGMDAQTVLSPRNTGARTTGATKSRTYFRETAVDFTLGRRRP